MNSYALTNKIINHLLKTIFVGSMVGVAILAPNSLKVVDIAMRQMDKRQRQKELHRVLAYMQRKSLIDWHELPDGQIEVKLTDEGNRRVQKVNFDELAIAAPKKWDKKWHAVIFDIPESDKKARRALSFKLRTLGLYQLQKSVWVYPYDCRREVELVREVFGIRSKYIELAEITKISSTEKLKQHFKLS